MSLIQDLFQTYGPVYLERFGDNIPEAHRQVIEAIAGCRTGNFGTHVFQCPDCCQVHIANSSCGNRHCPICQAEKSRKWLDRQIDNLLPCSYFMLTFTVPAELRGFLRSHQKAGYEALFQASSQALKCLAANQRFVGCHQAGFCGVLHTWGRTLTYHPHIHYIVPGGGLDRELSRWLPSKPDFFVHVKPLSLLFRSLFRKQMQKAGLIGQISPKVWNREWVVNSQPVGNGKSSMKYLAPYVFRVAISNNRILNIERGKVRFRYRKSGAHRWRSMQLDAIEFIRRFLQHVLPKGFMKIRHFGFLSPNARVSIQRVRELICVLYELLGKVITVRTTTPKFRPLLCTACGAVMRWQTFIPPGACLTGG